MPQPVFIICSEGGSIDRHTNQLSVFDVIEKLAFRQGLPPSDSNGSEVIVVKPIALNSLRMTAYWRQEEGDVGQEFDFQTTIQVPGIATLITAGEGKFVFKSELHRLIASIHTDMPPESGQMLVRNSIRRTGTTEWRYQDYVIPVERHA